MNAKSTLVGLLFLFGGIALFFVGILLMAWREKRRSGLKQSVSGFHRTRGALHNIFHAHERDRLVSREKARRAHPARGQVDEEQRPRVTEPRGRRPA